MSENILLSFVGDISSMLDEIQVEGVTRNRVSALVTSIVAFLRSAAEQVLSLQTLCERIGTERTEDGKDKPILPSSVARYATHVAAVIGGVYCPIPRLSAEAAQARKVLGKTEALVLSRSGKEMRLETLTPDMLKVSVALICEAKKRGVLKVSGLTLTAFDSEASEQSKETRKAFVNALLESYQ